MSGTGSQKSKPKRADPHAFKSVNKAIEICIHKNRTKGGKFVVVQVKDGFQLHNVTFEGFPTEPIMWARGAESALEAAAKRAIKSLLTPEVPEA